jgi:ketosteroid isomerase-like protein
MRALRWGLKSLVALGLALAMASAVSAQPAGDLMQEVTAIGDALEEAMVEGDVDSMVAIYAQDAISLPNYGPRLDGITAIRRNFEAMEAAGTKIRSFETSPSDVWESGDQVIEIGTFAISMEMPGMPEPVQDQGKYLTVYIRDAEGKLKIKTDIWNSDLNPMEMGAPEEEGGPRSF